MKFKDPIAPTYGGGGGPYERWFAWRPITTHDGYFVWLEYVNRADYGAANTTFREYSLIERLQNKTNDGGQNE